MNRRDFAAGALAAGALGLPGWAWAQKPPQDGNEYRALDRRVPVEAPAGKIEVVEFFWYSCPHCNAFEPKLVSWIQRQPADVVVRRVRDLPAGASRLNTPAVGVHGVWVNGEKIADGNGVLPQAQRAGTVVREFAA